MRSRAGHGKRLSYYDFGATPFYACAADPRFSYCLYVPQTYDEEGGKTHPLLVVVHGTGRDAMGYRDQFAALAERHGAVVLAPLFPGGITSPGELSSYKLIGAGALRYDHVLLAMVEEVSQRYRVRTDRFSLAGFSGGGHFAHRFLYLHPRRLEAVSIGAPGIVTLLDTERDWWVGLRDLETRFGIAPDIAAMRGVAVQMVVGEDDVDTWEIALTPGHAWWMDGADLASGTRRERLERLRHSFATHGIAVRHDVVPGVAHRSTGLASAVTAFLDDVLGAPEVAPLAAGAAS